MSEDFPDPETPVRTVRRPRGDLYVEILQVVDGTAFEFKPVLLRFKDFSSFAA